MNNAGQYSTAGEMCQLVSRAAGRCGAAPGGAGECLRNVGYYTTPSPACQVDFESWPKEFLYALEMSHSGIKEADFAQAAQ